MINTRLLLLTAFAAQWSCGSNDKKSSSEPTKVEASKAPIAGEDTDPAGGPSYQDQRQDVGNQDPSSTPSYDQVAPLPEQLNQPYQQYSNEINQPFVNERYQQNEQFLGYQNGFNNVQPGQYGWTQQNMQPINVQFQRSRQWRDVELVGIMSQTLSLLAQRNYSCRSGLDRRLQHAIDRHNFRDAARIHDQLLIEAYGQPRSGCRGNSCNPRRR